MTKKYLTFSKDHNLDAAKQTFRDRYFGIEPSEVYTEHGLLWVGPVPGSDLPDQVIPKPVKLQDQDGQDLQILLL